MLDLTLDLPRKKLACPAPSVWANDSSLESIRDWCRPWRYGTNLIGEAVPVSLSALLDEAAATPARPTGPGRRPAMEFLFSGKPPHESVPARVVLFLRSIAHAAWKRNACSISGLLLADVTVSPPFPLRTISALTLARETVRAEGLPTRRWARALTLLRPDALAQSGWPAWRDPRTGASQGNLYVLHE